VNNFFGFGNKTKIDPGKPLSYYRVRYRHSETQLLFQKRLFPTLKVMAGPVFYRYWNHFENNKSTILRTFDSTSVYSTKDYLGGKLVIDINNLNNELFPTRGVHWNTELSSLAALSKSGHNITKLQSDMTVYASLSDPARLIAVIQLGAGHISTTILNTSRH